MEDVKGALKTQNIDEESIKPGDAVLFNFGWWRVIEEKERYVSFKWPGIDEYHFIYDKHTYNYEKMRIFYIPL